VQYEVEINGRVRKAVVHREGGTFVVQVDGREWRVDAARIDPQSLSLLIEESPASSQSAQATRSLSREATIAANGGIGRFAVGVGALSFSVAMDGLRSRARSGSAAGGGEGPERILAPMPGKVVRVLVSVGTAVTARQPLVVIEAMKMENELRASRDGIVAEIQAREGQSVDAGALLAVIDSRTG
jgi:biotin carboxyl carrier protein